MLTIFFYNNPGWGLPCVSPFVTKTFYYLKMSGIPFRAERQNPATLHSDAPFGKLPYIVDANGMKVADSTEIMRYLIEIYGDRLDEDATVGERSIMHAWNRLIDEHLYWAGIIDVRWRDEENFEIYRPAMTGFDPVPQELRAALEQARTRTLQAHASQGMGRLPSGMVSGRARQDIDAVAHFLGDRAFFMGDHPRSIDAGLTSMLKHIMHTPFQSPLKDHALNHGSLIAYCERMDEHFGLRQLAAMP